MNETSAPTMRAKMRVESVTQFESSEKLLMHPVCKPGGYPADGADEDNTFAKWSPSGSLELLVTNPALRGVIKAGDKFYIDFTKVVDEASAAEPGKNGFE